MWGSYVKRLDDAEAEVERLRAALEAMRDATPQSSDWYQMMCRAALAREEA
jgi:hypothetical protein